MNQVFLVGENWMVVYLKVFRFFSGVWVFQRMNVYGLEDELLAMVLHPVLAVLFFFPVTSQTEEERLQLDKEKRFTECQENQLWREGYEKSIISLFLLHQELIVCKLHLSFPPVCFPAISLHIAFGREFPI
ncbi:hypothetical protein DITRI_Ditri04bG0102400 [Diplodiscus trichospermus]